MKQLIRSPLTVAVALASIAVAAPALAQLESAGENKPRLEEIIVTATKRDTNLMKTPIAITVISDEMLEQQGLNNIRDIGKLVPNMDISFDSSQTAPVISMRGVRSTNVTELGDPAVGLHLDGIYSPRPQGAMALMFDVERVEAQRGPQGTLFGRNSTVGNINVISRRPDSAELEGSVGVEFGSWDQELLKGMINIPVSDTFALRGSFVKETRDSYLNGYYDPNQWDIRYLPEEIRNAPLYNGPEAEKNLVQRERWWAGGAGAVQERVKADREDFYNNADQYAFRIAALWEPTDALSWTLAYEKFKDKSAGHANTVNCDLANKRIVQDGDGNYLDAQGNISDTPVTGLRGCDYLFGPGSDSHTINVSVPGKMDMTIESVRTNLKWNLNDSMALVYNGGWAEQTRFRIADMELGIIGWDMSTFENNATFESQSHELQLQSTGNERLSWITGLFWFEENNSGQGGWINSMANSDYYNQPERTLASEAIFAQGTYALSDQLHLTLGFRHTKDTKEDVGGRNMRCDGSNPNQVDPDANFGSCLPQWWREAFVALPGDYFWNSDIFTTATNNDIKGEWSYNNFRVGLDYDLSEDTFLFAYVANGNKSGGIGDVVLQYEQDPMTAEYPLDENGNRIVVKRHENTYDPEEVLTYEVGVKTELFGNSLRLAATAFYSDYSDMQVSAPAPLYQSYSLVRDPMTGEPTGEVRTDDVVVFQTSNIGTARITGLELEFDWAITKSDYLNGYITYLNTKITDDFYQSWGHATRQLFGVDADPNNPDLLVNLKGNELPSSPRYSLMVNYAHVFYFNSGAELVPWVTVSWKDDSYYSVYNTEKHEDLFVTETPDAFTDKRDGVTNVYLGLKYKAPGDKWNVEAYVNNATNTTDYYWGGNLDGYLTGPVSMPRSYGMRFNYNFF